MKLITLFLFFFIPVSLQAQNIKFKVIDSKTGQGIPYVNALFPETLNGAIADSSGNICINNDSKRNQLLITRIGYRDTLISIENLYLQEIKLESKLYDIPEVYVVGKLTKELMIGCQKKSPKAMALTNDKDGGCFVYFNRSSSAKISSIGINISSSKKSNIDLFIRVLDPDTTYKTIGSDMMLTYKKVQNLHDGWNDIDFKNENIRFSKNGIIIQFYIKVTEGSKGVKFNCSFNEPDYTWMSSTDYRRDFSLEFGERSYRPAVRIKIIE